MNNIHLPFRFRRRGRRQEPATLPSSPTTLNPSNPDEDPDSDTFTLISVCSETGDLTEETMQSHTPIAEEPGLTAVEDGNPDEFLIELEKHMSKSFELKFPVMDGGGMMEGAPTTIPRFPPSTEDQSEGTGNKRETGLAKKFRKTKTEQGYELDIENDAHSDGSDEYKKIPWTLEELLSLERATSFPTLCHCQRKITQRQIIKPTSPSPSSSINFPNPENDQDQDENENTSETECICTARLRTKLQRRRSSCPTRNSSSRSLATNTDPDFERPGNWSENAWDGSEGGSLGGETGVDWEVVDGAGVVVEKDSGKENMSQKVDEESSAGSKKHAGAAEDTDELNSESKSSNEKNPNQPNNEEIKLAIDDRTLRYLNEENSHIQVGRMDGAALAAGVTAVAVLLLWLMDQKAPCGAWA